jgi:hypothetical protein
LGTTVLTTMSKQALGTAEVLLIDLNQSHPFTLNCSTCSKEQYSFVDGYLIGLLVIDDGIEYRYILRESENTTCCDWEVCTPVHFETEHDARIRMSQIHDHLDTHNTTEGLNLMQILTVPEDVSQN